MPGGVFGAAKRKGGKIPCVLLLNYVLLSGHKGERRSGGRKAAAAARKQIERQGLCREGKEG
jgi:hypothetical protein